MNSGTSHKKEDITTQEGVAPDIDPAAIEAASAEISPLNAEADLQLAEAAEATKAAEATESTPTPARESRIKKTFLNARVNLIFYFLNLLLSFFTRKIFLDCLGADFLGLTGTLQNLLGFLNLAELGIGTAIGYLLYKPIFDRDKDKINEIISVMGYLYRWIGLIILGGGVILSAFLPLIFGKTEFPMTLIFFAFYSFLGSSLLGYFINYRQTLLSADQRNYVVTAYYQSANIAKTLLQLLLAYYTRNYYLWVAIELTFGVLYCLMLNWKLNQTYPWFKTEVKQGRKLLKKYPEVLKKSSQVFIWKITVMIATQSSNLLIYAFVSLSMVAYLTNYQVVIAKVVALITNVTGSAWAGIGNLIAEGNLQKTRCIYKELLSLYTFVGGIVAFGLFTFANPFIALWLGEQYVLPNWVMAPLYLLYAMEFVIGCNNGFVNGFGLFHDIWAAFTECALYLVIAIVCGYFWGLFGVLLGRTVSSVIINFGWKPYFLFSKGFKLPTIEFWKSILPLLVIQIASYGIFKFINDALFTGYQSLAHLFLSGIIITIFYISTVYWLFYWFYKPFRNIIQQRILPKVIIAFSKFTPKAK